MTHTSAIKTSRERKGCSHKAQAARTAPESAPTTATPSYLNLPTVPETAFDVVAVGALVTLAVVDPVVVVAFEFEPVGSAVFVGVITLPKGNVEVNPTAASSDTPGELSQAPDAGGTAFPAMNLIAAHCLKRY